MDRFVPRRQASFVLALMLVLTMWPAAVGLAKPPMISNEPAGDPGDGVLRPADSEPAAPSIQSGPSTDANAIKPSRTTFTCLLVPVLAPAGQPWPLTFRLIRVELADTEAGSGAGRDSFAGGRWHRAP